MVVAATTDTTVGRVVSAGALPVLIWTAPPPRQCRPQLRPQMPAECGVRYEASNARACPVRNDSSFAVGSGKCNHALSKSALEYARWRRSRQYISNRINHAQSLAKLPEAAAPAARVFAMAASSFSLIESTPLALHCASGTGSAGSLSQSRPRWPRHKSPASATSRFPR